MIDILFLIGLYLFGLVAVYALGFTFSDQNDDELKYFKGVRVNQKIKRILLPSRMSSHKNFEKMNILGVIFHLTVSTSFALLYPVFFVINFFNKELFSTLLVTWGHIAAIVTTLLLLLFSMDIFLGWIDRRKKKADNESKK